MSWCAGTRIPPPPPPPHTHTHTYPPTHPSPQEVATDPIPLSEDLHVARDVEGNASLHLAGKRIGRHLLVSAMPAGESALQRQASPFPWLSIDLELGLELLIHDETGSLSRNDGINEGACVAQREASALFALANAGPERSTPKLDETRTARPTELFTLYTQFALSFQSGGLDADTHACRTTATRSSAVLVVSSLQLDSHAKCELPVLFHMNG